MPRLAGKLFAILGVALVALIVLRAIVPAHIGPGPRATWWALALVAWGLAAAWRRRREPEPAPLSRDPGVLLLVGVLGLDLAVVFSHPARLVSDGVDHFVYLRSIVIDRDLDLTNDFAIFYPGTPREDLRTPIGRIGNPHALGPAIVWAPFYLFAELLARLLLGASTGASGFHRNAVAVASVIYGWAGLVLLYRALLPLTRRGIALLATLGIGCGTFLYWYLTFEPTMSHGMSFAAAMLVVALWLDQRPPTARRYALFGAACALAALMRWANVLLVLLPAGEWLAFAVRERRWRDLAKTAGAFTAAALLTFSPQMIVWQRLYGSPLTIPQGAGFISQPPGWVAVLFSPDHGLFSWTPILYLGLFGLVVFARRNPWRGAVAFAFLLAFTRVNAGVTDWWGGAAFGARRFDATLPLLGLGLALALDGTARLVERKPLLVAASLVAAFVFWNATLAHETAAGAWSLSEPVAFEQMGERVVARVGSAIGSPFSLPGALVYWARTGRAPTTYEAQFVDHRRGRWLKRDLGWEPAIELAGGWSDVTELRGERCRLMRGRKANLVVRVPGREAKRLGARLALASPGQALRSASSEALVHVLINGRPAGDWTATGEWREATIEPDPAVWQRMRNEIELTIDDGVEIAFATIWLRPVEGGAPPGAAGR